MTGEKDGVLLTAKEYTDLLVGQEREIREAWQRSQVQKFDVFLKGNDEHLMRLNHEAERIKLVQSSSVTAEKFSDYQDSQRAKTEAAEFASREAFTIYSNKVEVQLATLTRQINRWAGGIAALLAGLEVWLHYGGK